MKKLLILPLLFLMTLPVFAVRINANTQIEWNAIVVVAALHDAGLEGNSYDFHKDIVLTYNRILDDLLKRKTFSATEAASVCMQQCNKSGYLMEGQGGKKCSDICKNFSMALVSENNKGTNSIKIADYYGGEVDYHRIGRIYSSDKKFYSLSPDTKSATCNDAIYESSTDKKIAVCIKRDIINDDDRLHETSFKVIDPKYNGFNFVLECSIMSNYEGKTTEEKCHLCINGEFCM